MTPWQLFLLDIVKTLIGAFVGALLAFWVNRLTENRKIEREQRAACNLALTLLSKQYGDFLISKASVASNKKGALELWPGLPLWMQLQPTLFTFSVKQNLDIDSIAFLLEGHANIVERLLHAEVGYQSLQSLFEHLNEAAIRRDEIFAAHGGADNTPIDILEEWVGLAIVGKLSAVINSIDARLAADGDMYRKAGESLQQLMIQTYGEKNVVSFKPLGADMKKIAAAIQAT